MRLVVVDTNVIVIAFLSTRSSPAHILAMWERRDIAMVVSEPMLDQYGRALSYERVAARHGMDASRITDVIDGFRRFATLVEIEHVARVVEGDPDDDVVLATAVAGHAAYVITGDGNLLRIGEYRGIPIVEPAVFVRSFRAEAKP